QRGEWRIEHGLAVARFSRIEVFESLRARQLKRIVIGKVTLNDNLARTVAAAGTSSHLGQQLERALGRTKVRHRERRIRREDAHQRHHWKVVAFGDHLGSDENIDVAPAESAKNALEIANMSHRISIDAADAGIRKQLLQIGFDAFRSLANVVDVLTIAFR